MSNPGPAVTSTTSLGFGPGGPAQIGGSTTATVGFYGTTPVAKSAVTNTAVTALATTTLSQVGTSGKWGFASSTTGLALITRATQMQATLKSLMTALNAIGIV